MKKRLILAKFISTLLILGFVLGGCDVANDDFGGNNAGGGSGDSTKPNPPASVYASATTSNSITINWSSVSNADRYYVYRDTSATGDYTTCVGSSSTLSYIDTDLAVGTTYYYKVSSYNSAGESVLSTDYDNASTSAPYDDAGDGNIAGGDDSDGGSNNTGGNNGAGGGNNDGGGADGATKPNPPATVYASALSSSSITVSWSSVSNADRYYVYRDTSATGGFTTYRGMSSTLSYTDTGLAAGTTYYYKVSSHNSAGEGSLSTVHGSATTLSSGSGSGGGTSSSGESSSPLAAPPSVKVSLTPSEQGLRITWGSVTGAYTYNVYRASTKGNFGTTPYKSNVSGTAYDDTSVTLSYNTSYYYQIKAVNSTGTEGAASIAIGVTVPKVGVTAYKPANSEVTTTSGIRYGGLSFGKEGSHTTSGGPTIITSYSSNASYSDIYYFSPGSYKYTYAYSGTTDALKYPASKTMSIELKPFHSYVISVYNGVIKSDTVNVVND
jgi:fibronectin type 3 domain-containing protein